ncbi:Cof-type HAD-IIB family hydrolase [Bacillus sp. T33-2]|uniref:Cof-type HAD-IIB family hydrolase n=1 Tax=Bacillus sp. T33-2 TaxID=2054168 RepID=UPI000C75F2B6|nr:Cof-type HAD-IIB family hydrolase [Bacillus sp. T33-2]PLR97453.1 Cof-type HAD-IIB family hydrolase [Bacillus sp. T33-2]
MKKIVFFDIDGTLLDHDKLLPASTKEGIRQLKEEGIFVAIATGRAPFMFESLRQELDIDSFVSFNGQFVVFENEVIYRNPLEQQEIERLLQHAETNGHPLVFMNDRTMKASVQHHEHIEQSLGTLKFPHPEEDRHFYINREIYQALLFCGEDEEHEYVSGYDKFRLIRWHPHSTDILPAGGSKAEGIKKMMSRLGFKLEDAYAFGDGLNDIEMLQTVGTGIAMGNAVHEVKSHADLVTKDVSSGGIMHGLKEIGLI